MGQLLADLNLIGCAGYIQRLLSVFTATNSTPLVPERTMRLTTLLPPPPYADDLDVDNGLGAGFQSKCHNVPPAVFCTKGRRAAL